MSLLLAQTPASAPGLDLPPVGAGWWIGFIVVVVALILADLFVLNKDAHEISVREAAISSAAWIAIGITFGIVVWFGLGSQYGVQYFTGYVIEKSLSVDNVFVWAVILGYFGVPRAYQHRVLFWGIFGALILRTIFVFAGVELITRFEWMIVLFGGFLVFTGIRVATHSDEEIHPDDNPILKLLRKRVAMTTEYHGAKFFIKEAGKRLATPMFAVLVLVEATDVIFAVDSIPAILAISHSQFVILSSNAFAILGLRALFFVLAGYQDRLVHLNKGLGVILVYVGIKMLVAFDLEIGGHHYGGYHIPVGFSLAFISIVLALTVFFSLRSAPGHPGEGAGDHLPG